MIESVGKILIFQFSISVSSWDPYRPCMFISFIETRFNLLLHLEMGRRLDFLHSGVSGWGTIHKLVHLYVSMGWKNKTFLHTSCQLLVFSFMFGVTFLKYCDFCYLFRNQVACLHRWGKIWFISFSYVVAS